MTRDLAERDALRGRTSGPGVVAHSAPPPVAGEGEQQAERSDEPFALLRAAIEQREEPDRVVRVRG